MSIKVYGNVRDVSPVGVCLDREEVAGWDPLRCLLGVPISLVFREERQMYRWRTYGLPFFHIRSRINPSLSVFTLPPAHSSSLVLFPSPTPHSTLLPFSRRRRSNFPSFFLRELELKEGLVSPSLFPHTSTVRVFCGK